MSLKTYAVNRLVFAIVAQSRFTDSVAFRFAKVRRPVRANQRFESVLQV